MKNKSNLIIFLGIGALAVTLIAVNAFYSGSDDLKGAVRSTTSSMATLSLSNPTVISSQGVTDDAIGSSVATGDLNGDGYDDLIVGSPDNNASNGDGTTGSGSVYVLYRNSKNFTSAEFKLTGETFGDQAGSSVAAGDLNGDGYDDLIVGAKGASAVYVLYGNSTNFTSASLSTAVKFTGETNTDQAGSSVAAGDLNGDGYDDLIVGAPYNNLTRYGPVYVLYGSSTNFTSASLSTAVKFTGEASVSSVVAGDLNGDGYDDLIVGAYGDANTGAVYVLYGSSTNFTSASLSTAVKFTGETVNDRAGWSVAAGDLNGDGYDDLIVGAYLNKDGGAPSYASTSAVGTSAGAVYVLYGGSTNFTSASLSTAVEFTGETNTDEAGWSVAAGDLNGDGYDDLIVGSRMSNYSSGAVFIVSGRKKTLNSSNLSSVSNLKLTGEWNHYAGWSVAAGDLNGDGYDDLVVGASGGSASGGSGAVYIISGR